MTLDFHPIINSSLISTDSSLQLSPIVIKDDYRKKWNIHENNFVCLTKGGNLISDALYRVGGIGGYINDENPYFMLLKYVEAFYNDSITKITKDKPHLEGRWCIIDKKGIEKKEFGHFKTPYIIKNSVIYSVDSNYYNIETGEFYGYGYTTMNSTNYLFIDNAYDKDKSKCGVIKINKKEGTSELFQ